MNQTILAQLAPTGVLRAGINMSNFLLVTGRGPNGEPDGVSPGMARAVAERLGVKVQYVPFPKPGELADAVGTGVWDIGLIGAEPQRAEKIAFTAAYVEIEATYLVPLGSSLQTIAEVDRPGIRIAVGDMLRAMDEVRQGSSALVRRIADPAIAAIVGTWPAAFTAERALALGFVPHEPFVEVVRAFIEDDLEATKRDRGLGG